MQEAKVVDFNVNSLPMLRQTNAIFTSKGLLGDYLDLARKERLRWDVAVLQRPGVPNHHGHLKTDLDYIVLIGKLGPKRGLEDADYSKLFCASSWERLVPWAKPTEVICRLLRLYSEAGDAIFDPFVGSGTTIIAAEMTARKALAIEIDPIYCDVNAGKISLEKRPRSKPTARPLPKCAPSAKSRHLESVATGAVPLPNPVSR